MSKEQKVLAQRVKRGAALLDKKMPKWFTSIDLTMLDMESPNACILGQSGSYNGDTYWEVGEKLKVIIRHDWVGGETNQSKAITHGFNIENSGGQKSISKSYSMLAELWAVEVALRLVRQ